MSEAQTFDHLGSIRFRDAGDQERFERQGYLTVPLLDDHQLTRLRRLWQEVAPERLEGIYSNVHASDLDTNRRIDEVITAAFAPGAARLFADAHLGGSSFLVKGTGPDSASTLHQDWNNVEEDRAVSLSIWAPLVDVGPENGQLLVLPGSHRLRQSIRSLDTPSLYLDFSDDLDAHLMPVPLRAGEAVLYAHNLFHGSRPNRTDSIRVAAVSGVLPRGARNVHYRRRAVDGPASFEVLEVERDFYFGGIAAMKDGALPPTARPVATVSVPDHQLRPDEVVPASATPRGLGDRRREP